MFYNCFARAFRVIWARGLFDIPLVLHGVCIPEKKEGAWRLQGIVTRIHVLREKEMTRREKKKRLRANDVFRVVALTFA